MDASNVGIYMSKVQGLAQEMLRMDRKNGGRTEGMFSLLRRAVDGDDRARFVWKLYEQGTKGRRALGVSRSWAKRVPSLVVPDEVLSEPDDSLEFVGRLESAESEAMVRRCGGLGLFVEAVGDGTPAAFLAAVEWLRGLPPWWSTVDESRADGRALAGTAWRERLAELKAVALGPGDDGGMF
jgi:hypothetical protein